MMRATGYLYIKTDYNLNNRVLFRQNLIKKSMFFCPTHQLVIPILPYKPIYFRNFSESFLASFLSFKLSKLITKTPKQAIHLANLK